MIGKLKRSLGHSSRSLSDSEISQNFLRTTEDCKEKP